MTKRKRNNKISKNFTPKRERTLGKAPGTITYVGTRKDAKTSIKVLTYGPDFLEYQEPESPEALGERGPGDLTQWVNVVGISDEAAMGQIGKSGHISNLVIEDIVNTQQRPKIEEYEDHIFGVFKMFYLNQESIIVREHVALVLTRDRVYVFQEVQADVFGGVRKRIEQRFGKIRERKADYLFFALIDALVDHYFIVLEVTEAKLYALETEVFQKPNPETQYQIQQLRKEINSLRRWMIPVRELSWRLIESKSPLIKKETRVFLRDVLDHSIEINDTLEFQQEMAFSLMDMYMGSVSNRMNEVMKVLTIMASIFIPLTFIAGIYGMNFDNMPELHWKYGYMGVLGFMALLFIVLLIFFKRKRWL